MDSLLFRQSLRILPSESRWNELCGKTSLSWQVSSHPPWMPLSPSMPNRTYWYSTRLLKKCLDIWLMKSSDNRMTVSCPNVTAAFTEYTLSAMAIVTNRPAQWGIRSLSVDCVRMAKNFRSRHPSRRSKWGEGSSSRSSCEISLNANGQKRNVKNLLQS